MKAKLQIITMAVAAWMLSAETSSGQAISTLNAHTNPDDADVTVIVDVSEALAADRTKKITWDSMRLGMFTLADDPLTFSTAAALGIRHRSLTTAQITTLTAGAAVGDVVWNSDAAGGATLQVYNGATWDNLPQRAALEDILNNTVTSTGVLTGGVLTKNGATTYDISDGTGLVATAAGVVTPVTWSGKTAITPVNIGTSLLSWVSIDSAGNVVERVAPISASQARSEIFLGVIVHTDLATVQTVNNEQVVAYQPLSTVHDLSDAIGFINISGNEFTANGVNLNINKSAGIIFKMGSNYNVDTTNPHNRTLAGLVASQFQYRFSDGTSGPLTDTNIDPDNLDDGAGGLTAVGVNKWSVQRIYSFISNNVKIQRGVTEYNTEEDAILSLASEPYITEPSIAANGLLRAWLVVKQGATDLSSAEATFYSAPKFGEGSSGGPSSPSSPIEGTAILSTGETLGTKVLTENGAGGAVWAAPAGGGLGTSLTSTTEDITTTGNIDLILSDAAGASKVSIQDSALAEVASIDSNGNMAVADLATPTLAISGATSGTVTVNVPAVAGTNTITIPAETDTLATRSIATKLHTGALYLVGTDDAREPWGGVIYATATTDIDLPAVSAGMSVTVIADAAAVITIDPDGTEVIRLEGVDLAAGFKIKSGGTIGEIVVLTYHSSGKWYAATSSFITNGS